MNAKVDEYLHVDEKAGLEVAFSSYLATRHRVSDQSKNYLIIELPCHSFGRFILVSPSYLPADKVMPATGLLLPRSGEMQEQSRRRAGEGTRLVRGWYGLGSREETGKWLREVFT